MPHDSAPPEVAGGKNAARGRYTICTTGGRNQWEVAWGSVAALLITGLLKTPDGMLLDTSTEFGRFLLVKHILFGLMILVGGFITFGVAPRLRKLAPTAGERPSEGFVTAQSRLEFLSGTNMILGILVLLIISMF